MWSLFQNLVESFPSFGSKIRSKKYGIIFNDQLADAMNLWVNEYGLIPDSFKSHRKPLSLATPAMVLDKDDNLQMVIGAAGGRYIPTTLAQVRKLQIEHLLSFVGVGVLFSVFWSFLNLVPKASVFLWLAAKNEHSDMFYNFQL